MISRHRVVTGALGLLVVFTLGCAAASPFSVPTPGLATLEEEQPYFYEPPDRAAAALAGTNAPRLADRVENLIGTYQEELERANRARGGLLHGVLSVTSLVLPLAGTVSALALSNPDDVETVSVATGIATTVIVGLNLIFKPQERASRAATCATFLGHALEALEQRWDRENLQGLQGTNEEWAAYLGMRSSLDAGRQSSCR